MILKGLELVFADQLQPGCGPAALAAHRDSPFLTDVFILSSYSIIFFGQERGCIFGPYIIE